MKKVIAGLLAIAIHFSAVAEPGKRESIKELLELTNADAMIDTIYSQLDQMSAGMAQQLGITASEQKIFERYMGKVSTSMKEDMSWEKMEAPMIDIYLANYTEKELQDMLAFYRSDTGRSLIEKMPAVMGESMVLSQKMMEGFMPKIQQITKEMAEELKAHRASQQTPKD